MPSHLETITSSTWTAQGWAARVIPWLCALSLCTLVACGGGNGADAAPETQSADTASASRATPSPAPPATVALQQEGARLNSAELEQIAKTGVLPPAFEGRELSGAAEKSGAGTGTAKSAASRVPVYRFFNTRTSAHFFTTSETERATVQATLPHMSFEGPAFHASSTAVPGLSPVHRFYNTATGVHFYTITESERAHVAATLPQFTYEGVAYHASTLPGTGYTPLYRFFYAAKGFHFYTNSAAEKDTIIATLRQYTYEGVGYHVLGSDWQTPAVPHTGITSAQCYPGGGNTTLGNCSSAGAINLNPQQDGHRAAVNPMSYSSVTSGGTIYPFTSCVRDNVTGLIWEGKEAAELAYRSGTKFYRNRGDNAIDDASTYVVAVNAFRICGFNDWRLPTVEELQGLVDYGRPLGLKFNATAFPNTQAANYWTANTNANANQGTEAWVVSFFNGTVLKSAQVINHLRLVRGAPWTGQRYLLTTRSYPGDSTNNAALDRKTGLTWRRCQQGRFWNGSTCTGTMSSFSIDGALAHAKDQTGWRMPNVKELNSLTDYTRYLPAFDPTLFPGDNGINGSSTPRADNGSISLFVQSIDGYVGMASGVSPLRLVSSSP